MLTNGQQNHPTGVRELLQESWSILCQARKVKHTARSFFIFFLSCYSQYNFTAHLPLTTIEEPQIPFAILILLDAKNDNHLAARNMFDATISDSPYGICMNCDRLMFLLNCLRFYSIEAKQKRTII